MGWGDHLLDQLEVNVRKVNSYDPIFTSCQQQPIILILFTFNTRQAVNPNLPLCYRLKNLALLLDLPELNIPILTTRHQVLVVIGLEVIKLLRTFLEIDLYKVVDPALVCPDREVELPVIGVHDDDQTVVPAN